MKQKNPSRNIQLVAESALMLALLVVIQLLSFVVPKSIPLLSQLVTGSLVNLVLIVGSGTVGLAVMAAASILSPLLAFIMGQMAFPQMILVIALGNFIIVFVSWMFFHNRENGKSSPFMDILGIALGSVAKWLFLWGATVLIIVPTFFQNQPAGAKLSMMFSWPQLVTALIGGFISLFVFPSIRNYGKKR